MWTRKQKLKRKQERIKKILSSILRCDEIMDEISVALDTLPMDLNDYDTGLRSKIISTYAYALRIRREHVEMYERLTKQTFPRDIYGPYNDHHKPLEKGDLK